MLKARRQIVNAAFQLLTDSGSVIRWVGPFRGPGWLSEVHCTVWADGYARPTLGFVLVRGLAQDTVAFTSGQPLVQRSDHPSMQAMGGFNVRVSLFWGAVVQLPLWQRVDTGPWSVGIFVDVDTAANLYLLASVTVEHDLVEALPVRVVKPVGVSGGDS